MKKISLILLLFSTKILLAQVEKQVGDFNKVTAFDQIDVQLIPSQETKVILNGTNSEIVEVINKNGELKLRMPLTNLLNGDDVSATVYYKNINAVEANEGSRIAGENEIIAANFEVIAKEGSEVFLKLNTSSLTLKLNDGSKATILGTAANQDVLINAGSIYTAKGLKTSRTVITANAGGQAAVYASDFVDAKVRAGGEISIYGKPKKVTKKTIAGGKIYEKEE